jgi:hypothetical protein
MGGLISRYYLEVLGGWQDCRTLFTFGTPYRGSIHAIDALANGLRKGSINFGELLQLGSMIQSLNSIYQLMPRYKALQVGSTYYRVAESPVPLPNIDPQKAADALAFHNEIDDAADANQANPLYRQSFVTCPVVGVNQPTLQSAKLVDGQIQVSEELPVYLGDRPQLATGDGTVPQVSATPVQMTDLDLVSIADYISESHGALQIQPDILLGILSGIQALQTPTLEDVRGAMESVTRSTRSTVSGICLSTEDVYWTNEAITARATVTGEEGGNTLAAEISSVDNQSISFTKPLKREENQWSLTVDGLKSGLYKITVKPNQLSGTITPVHSIFEVIDPLSLEANHG